jgi:hypothetical protein
VCPPQIVAQICTLRQFTEWTDIVSAVLGRDNSKANAVPKPPTPDKEISRKRQASIINDTNKLLSKMIKLDGLNNEKV